MSSLRAPKAAALCMFTFVGTTVMRSSTRFLLFLRLFIEQALARKTHIQNAPIPTVCQVSPYLGNDCQPPGYPWYYDDGHKSCKMLTAGLCSFSSNQFPTESVCNETCQSSTKRTGTPCLQKPVSGKCSTIYRAWYFDIYSMECKMFSYIYCRKRINFFNSETKCQSVCLPHRTPKPLCSLQPLSKFCVYRTYHWYFSSKNNICLAYLKHQCAKTNNRFKTHSSCMKRCSYSKH
uniref:Putative trilaris n=1 Tax=Rhipicephalus pulchellus TaxID=72859 RepID=L7LPQ3_RHIPC